MIGRIKRGYPEIVNVEVRMRQLLTWVVFLLFLAACRQEPPLTAPTPLSLPTATATASATADPPPSATIPPTLVATPTTADPAVAVIPIWPTPIPAEAALSRTAVSRQQVAAADELHDTAPPRRDNVALAIAHRGFATSPLPTPELVTEPLPVGTEKQFYISNSDTNVTTQIDARLLAVSDHAYFWFDTGPGTFTPDDSTLAHAAAVFDTIYEQAVTYFGTEANPGVDGDPRVYIVNASPLALCDVTVITAGNCGLAGYFSDNNLLPAAVDPASNAHEMFIMNLAFFGSDYYLGVLAHEFRHMIESNYDRGDADWAVEGSAVLAESLLGFAGTGQQRGNIFLQNPDQQLNSWTESNTLSYYGQGYLLNQYIFDRLGPDLYYQFATSPAHGLQAVDEVARTNGLDLTGESLWLAWLATLAIHNHPNAPPLYQYSVNGLNTAALTPLPDGITETTVHQYAADYYELASHTDSVTVDFTGSTLVPLLDTLPRSGHYFWYAQRSNVSNPRLTRSLDLRHVAAATLHYSIYTDIERGYDFAYISVSLDNGRTWQGLTAEHMQGLDPLDDPSASALTPRFYTGRNRTWVDERVDLSQYAGQVIQLRFEYVTDLILTYGGVAIDNIAVPEIGFYDDAETDVAGWTAEGFTRATAYLPQTWHLQLITFGDAVPVVEEVTIGEGQTASFVVNGEQTAKRPILIVAATAPLTLEPAHYRLSVNDNP